MEEQEDIQNLKISQETQQRIIQLEERINQMQDNFEKKITVLQQENKDLKEKVHNQDQKIQELDELLKQKSQTILRSISQTKQNFGSQIANISDFQLICSWLNIPSFQEGDLKLIYSSDKHGFCIQMTKQAFMDCCCDISPTLIICQSSWPYITKFGAYTETKWIKTDFHQYTSAPEAFLFSLTRKSKILQYKFNDLFHKFVNYQIRNFEKAQWHTGMQSSWIFGFGMADDFAVKEQKDMNPKSNQETNEMSESELGHTFGSGFLHGSENAQSFLAGAHEFRIGMIEVFTCRAIIKTEIDDK